MQGHHLLPHPPHHQQLQHQLAALLSAALPHPASLAVDAYSSSGAIPSSASLDEPDSGAEADRVAAIESLQRAIIHPPNALVIAHSATFLSQGLAQLLSDTSSPVRRAAAFAYGSLSAVMCALPFSSNGSITDVFIGWALPLMRRVGVENGTTELAFIGIRQFLDAGVSNNAEGYVLQILKSCQDGLEDERTPLELLRQFLGVLTLIALKYEDCFQPHFVDIVDLLLGWALVPDLSETERKILTDSFMQFKNLWVRNLQFSLSLLVKFLGDMEVLVQDNGILGNSQKSGRLMALFRCFSSVIQVAAYGTIERNLQMQISEPIEKIVPRLLDCLLVVGKKLEWDKWMGESWRCILLLAEVLQEKFSEYYAPVIDILFQSLEELPSSLLLKLLKDNKRVLSLQKHGLVPLSVHKMLQFGSPFAELRLHPNRSVARTVAFTYLYFAKHDCDDVVLEFTSLLTEELKLLKDMQAQAHSDRTSFRDAQMAGLSVKTSLSLTSRQSYSESELISLIKFDLSMIVCSFWLFDEDYSTRHTDVVASYYARSIKLSSFLVENLNPFQSPIQDILELQVYVAETFHRLCEVELQSRLISCERAEEVIACVSVGENETVRKRPHSKECWLSVMFDHLKKYSAYVVGLLNELSPLAAKLEALEFISSICRVIMKKKGDSCPPSLYESCEFVGLGRKLLCSVLKSASDREVKVRLRVASVLELLVKATLISPERSCYVAEVILDKLGDHDIAVKNSFIGLLSTVLPVTTYVHGIFRTVVVPCEKELLLNWKCLFALKKLPRQLRSRQLLTILSYISQRSKVPLTSWIQRLAFSCHSLKDCPSRLHEEKEIAGAHSVLLNGEAEDSFLDRICPVNDIAVIWWAIHEAARHCVSLRLRTNLGGPAQTFAALERMLLDVSQVLLLDSDQREGNLKIGSSHVHMLPMRLLLDFVESLKKNVYNAYEGSCVMPCPNRQSLLFFRANKKVCEEWFSRICEPMLNASLALHCHDATFYYSAVRLQDLQNLYASSLGERNLENLNILKGKFAEDVMKVLRDASLALSRNHEPEALVGLHNWAVMTLSPMFTDGHNDSGAHFSWMMGLVYQAYGQYEKAATHFSHLLQSEVALSCMGSDGIQFAIGRIIECYTAVSDWKSLELWLSELQMLRTAYAGKAYCGALTTAGTEMNAVHALARFDEGDTLGSWGYLDLTPKSINELTLDLKLGLERSEQLLLRAMLLINQKEKMLEELNKAKLMLNEGLSLICLDGLSEAVPYAMQLHCISAFKDNSRFNCEDQSSLPPAQLKSLYHVLQFPLSKVHQDCSLWLKVFRVYRTLMTSSPVTLFFCKRLMDLARKQSNFMLANRMGQYLHDHMSICWQGDQLNLFSGDLTYEKIKLDYSMGKHEGALARMWSFVLPEIMSPESVIGSQTGKMSKAKALLKLSTWLKQDYLIPNLENVIYSMQGDLENISSSLTRKGYPSGEDSLISGVNWHVLREEIVGMVVKISRVICPHMCKTWLYYASWCYHQARNSFHSDGTVIKLCTLSSILLPEVVPDRYILTEEEISKVEILIRRFLQHKGHKTNSGDLEDRESVTQQQSTSETVVSSLVQQVAYLIQSAAGLPSVEHSDGECPSNVVTSQLTMFLQRTNSECERDDLLLFVNELVEIWWSLRRRRVSLFGLAAHGYLQYLSLSSSKVLERQSDQPDFTCANEKPGNCTLRATLNVLQILLDYGAELKETLGPGLTRVPLLPWQEIIPQLFARLSSHPQQEVREQLQGLLTMLAKRSPWSIVYPTLVDANASDGKSSVELSRILACLTRLYPKLIQDVRLIISELASITVLWEDQWLSTLQDLHADVMKRINTLKEDATRIEENATLSYSEKKKINATKYSAMMAPVVVALERRLASTSRVPETPHEIWFQKEYSELLKSALLSFKTPPSSTLNLGDIWKPFNSIAASLLSYQRKPLLSLSEVAPRLSLLRSSDVPMPGLDINSLVTVSSFGENLVILSTKTRPKKLILLGSDGQKHTYLLKGREDLRLDARIMQLLQAVDRSLRSSSDTHGRSLAVRYYSVTPISGRAGLIQWVDHVTSIYSVYKSWQTRVQFSHFSAAGEGDLKSTAAPVPRPGDMFYGKIIPALKEKGIRKVVSRRDWPHDVKRKVLLDLMKETPRQLLHQELWCASEGFKAFSARSKRFSGSIAVMSMVGYILGLGDRHLDNILLDFDTGDVVHIDYNVCFDKGKRLKIPEIVPFRLTQTIEAPLGLTGIEGIFKANCEAVLDVLRKNKDVLLLLLEAFVWDPLVEWMRGDAHDEAVIGGEEKKGMELAVSLSLFASRFQEVRVPLQEHHDLLLSTLPASEFALEKFLDMLNRYEIVSATFFQADQERSSLLQREISVKLIVAEATSISEKIRSSFDAQAHEFAQAKAVVTEKAQESTMWLEHHGRILDALRSGSVDELQSLIKPVGSDQALSITSSVSAASVPLSIVPEPTQAQCYDLDREVSRTVAELSSSLSLAVDALQDYATALQRVLPLNYITTSPVHSWAQILQLSVNKHSPDVLSLSRRQAGELLAKTQDGIPDSLKQRHGELALKVEQHSIEIENVRKECSVLVSSLGMDSEKKSKDRLLTAFIKYMRSVGYGRLDAMRDSKPQGDLVEKATKTLTVLRLAANELFKGVRNKVSDFLSRTSDEECLHPSSEKAFYEFEGQIENCVLLVGVACEIQRIMGVDFPDYNLPMDDVNWASVFHASINSCKNTIDQMLRVVLPEVITSVISCNTEVMETFGSLSQIRGSVDTALEQLIEIELERASLIELEENYFVKVGLFTEKKLALEEASMKGRDNLSWEEAEELASQEEACRDNLDQLHQSWNEKDMQISALKKREASVINSLVTSERQLLSLLRTEEGDLQNGRSKALLSMAIKPFSELESLDHNFSSYGSHDMSSSFNLSNFINSSHSISASIWKLANLLKSHSFFVWKTCVLDSFLDSCIRDISSSMDRNVGFDQLYSIMKRKLFVQLQGHFNLYIRNRIAPAFMLCVEKEDEISMQSAESNKEIYSQDLQAVNRVKQMLEEYCNAHESARAAKAAVSRLKYQEAELAESLQKTVLEVVQMEWLHDQSLPHQHKIREISESIIPLDKLPPVLLNLSRSKLLEKMQSSMSSITTSLEHLKVCERTCAQTEAQLERAMSWACAGPSNSGIPPEFHNHLLKRRQFLWAAQEQASNIISICSSVIAFELSRDGLFRTIGDTSTWRTMNDSKTWQKTYLNSVTRLEVIFHSFTRAEQEWRLAQSNLASATNSLLIATNELSMASAKAKSASGDLHSTLAALRDSAYEASAALSAFSRVSKFHNVLTVECGNMLEEVLAITEGVHDVYRLGKEAATLHAALMADLSKASAILLPLEVSLSTDIAALSDSTMSREREARPDISPMHAQALYKFYCFTLRESCQLLRSLVPSITYSVKELHAMVTRLAKTASHHAGNLHKAFEGLGESQMARSQEFSLSSEELEDVILEGQNKDSISGGGGSNREDFAGADGSFFQDDAWISPPDSIYSSSASSVLTSGEVILSGNADRVEQSSALISEEPEASESTRALRSSTQERYSSEKEEREEAGPGGSENESLNPAKGRDQGSQSIRGKNAYAVAVLRQVERKLEGRELDEKRAMGVAEQVDYLLKQATSVDNLCNMYEGWTPWI